MFKKTIGLLIDKANLTVISSVDEMGFPVSKAMLAPRKREGIKVFISQLILFSQKFKILK